MKSISVIIPTYNREATITKAIESVLNQTYPVQEVIVVDDGSTDNTEEVVGRIEDERIRYFKTPENHGAGAARNYGVKQARCELIAFHDSDDEWLPEKIERQMAYLEEHPDVGLVYTSFTAYIDNKSFVFPEGCMDKCDEYEGNLLRKQLIGNVVGAPTILMPKSVFEELDGFDENMTALEDWEFAIRVASKYPLGFVAEPCVKVSLEGNRMSSDVAKHYKNNCYILAKHADIYLREQMLDAVAENLLLQAKHDGVGDAVGKMLLLYFQQMNNTNA